MDPVIFQRTPTGLIPTDEASKEVLYKFAVGASVKVTLKGMSSRSLRQHRWFFGLIGLLWENAFQDQFKSIRSFRTTLKYLWDEVDVIEFQGRRYPDPRSWSFAAMAQEEFNALVDKAVAWIQRTLPDWNIKNREELERMVNEYLAST